MLELGNKVTSIRIDEETWKRAKIAAIEEETTLSELVKDALDIVIGWREIIDDTNLNFDEETLKKMLESRSRGEKPFKIEARKTAEEIVREGRDRWL